MDIPDQTFSLIVGFNSKPAAVGANCANGRQAAVCNRLQPGYNTPPDLSGNHRPQKHQNLHNARQFPIKSATVGHPAPVSNTSDFTVVRVRVSLPAPLILSTLSASLELSGEALIFAATTRLQHGRIFVLNLPHVSARRNTQLHRGATHYRYREANISPKAREQIACQPIQVSRRCLAASAKSAAVPERRGVFAIR